MFIKIQVIKSEVLGPHFGNDTFRRATIGYFLVDSLRNGKRTNAVRCFGPKFGTIKNGINLVTGMQAMLQFLLSLDHEKTSLTTFAGLLLQSHEQLDFRILNARYLFYHAAKVRKIIEN